MPTVFQLRYALALAIAIAGATMLAMPANLLGQTITSGPQANAVQQPAAFASDDSIDQLAQAPQSPAPSAPGTAAPGPAATLPTAPVPAVPNPNALAQSANPGFSGMGLANGAAQQFSLATTPNMIGDLRGGGYMFTVRTTTGNTETTSGGTLPIAGGDRLTKISEDTSPIPTDRVFADFNHFNGAALTVDGRIIDVNRYTFGIEKTFFDGACSIEIRAPIENGLSADESDPAGANGNVGTSLGDVSIIPKVLVAKSDTWASSVGLAVTLPTAPDVSNTQTAFDSITYIKNDSLHLQPFVGLLLAPSTRLFSISYIQLDFDANGSPVTSQSLFGQPGPVVFDGRLRDPTLMYVDMSVGYWLFDARDESRNSWLLGGYISGIAPIVELHYTTSLQPFTTHVTGITSEFAREDILDMTAGLSFQLGPMSNLTVAACAPLRTTLRDKEFDSEVIVEFDRRF